VKIVYIAGPYRAPTAWGIAENVRAAERVGLEVARLGAMPLIPHSMNAHFHGEGDDQLWLDGTLELLRRCDAAVFIPGWTKSSGSRGEWEEAQRRGMPRLCLEGFDREQCTQAIGAWVRRTLEVK
jgi:hypothetical protein